MLTAELTPRQRKITFVALATALVLWTRKRETKPQRQEPFVAKRYRPGSAEQIALFEQAADAAGLPREWASDPSFIELLTAESAGWVGIPNYQYGRATQKDHSRWPHVWAQLRAGFQPEHSSATGLGQLTIANVDAYYPDGRAGIGDALNEAVGMLKYIADRYGDPGAAWEFHQSHNWY